MISLFTLVFQLLYIRYNDIYMEELYTFILYQFIDKYKIIINDIRQYII